MLVTMRRGPNGLAQVWQSWLARPWVSLTTFGPSMRAARAVSVLTQRWQCQAPACFRMRMVNGSKWRLHVGQSSACSFQMGTRAERRALVSFR